MLQLYNLLVFCPTFPLPVRNVCVDTAKCFSPKGIVVLVAVADRKLSLVFALESPSSECAENGKLSAVSRFFLFLPCFQNWFPNAVTRSLRLAWTTTVLRKTNVCSRIDSGAVAAGWEAGRFVRWRRMVVGQKAFFLHFKHSQNSPSCHLGKPPFSPPSPQKLTKQSRVWSEQFLQLKLEIISSPHYRGGSGRGPTFSGQPEGLKVGHLGALAGSHDGDDKWETSKICKCVLIILF